MNDPVNDATKEAALIIFGRQNDARAPRAAWFRAENAEAVEKMAGEMGFQILAIASDEVRGILGEISEGRFAANGRAQIPTLASPIYERLCVLFARHSADAGTDIPDAAGAERQANGRQDIGQSSGGSLDPGLTDGPLEAPAQKDPEPPQPSPPSNPVLPPGLPAEAIVPAIIVYGRTGLGRARAGWFTRIEAALTRKAADMEGFRWLPVQTKEQHLAASEISRGRLLGNLTLLLPTILTGLFEHLNRIALRMGGSAEIPNFAEGVHGKSRPTTWEDVGVGSHVLVQDGEGGFWEAKVLNRLGDQLVIAWQDDLEEPIFHCSIQDIALRHPAHD